MSYSSTTIARVVDDLNRTLFLPAIQRPFVWEPDQVIALFDSLLKGYPISSFLFWEVRPENRDNWEIYRFVERFRYGDVHNELVDPDGRDVVLVLDGQQRLTSLVVGLRGSYTVKLKHKRWNNPDAWSERKLYIDLFKDPAADDDTGDLGITYGLRFFAEPPTSGKLHHWVKLGQILDFHDDDAFDEFKERVIDSFPGDVTRDQERLARRTLDRLHRTIWKDEVVAFYTEKSQNYDRVLDIFIRANDGGTKLSKSDLLLSMITSKWKGMNAREEIYEFVEHLNEELERKNNIDKDFIMRSCLVLCDLDTSYKVENFTIENLGVIERAWPRIKESVRATVRLANRFGLDRDTLTSVNALLPIAYFLHVTDSAAVDGSTPQAARDRESIRRWLLAALLNNVFSGSVGTTIPLARRLVREGLATSDGFPIQALADGLRQHGRISTLDGEAVEALLELRYGRKSCFLALSLLYDEQSWGWLSYQIDHILPKSAATSSKLEGMGLGPSRVEEIQSCVDRLGNLQLLPARENGEKSSLPFSDWIKTRDAGFLRKHLIPEDPFLWTIEKLPEFVAARERLIRERLRMLTGSTPEPAIQRELAVPWE